MVVRSRGPRRSELRDLVDVQALLTTGGDLVRGLEDAPRKDSGFSPLTLACLLEELRVHAVGQAEGWPEERIAELEQFRDSLLIELEGLSRP